MPTPETLFASQVRQRRYRDPAWWRRTTVYLIEEAGRGGAEVWHEKMPNYIVWVDVCREEPQICDPDLLAAFVAEFARLASSVGESGTVGQNVLSTLERALEIAGRLGQPVVPLYRAKAIYHRTREVESGDRLAALNAALRHAQKGSNEWLGTLVDLSEYYVEVSLYRDALHVLKPIEELRKHHELPARYQVGVDVAKGVALFTSFQNLSRAQFHLRRAAAVPIDPHADPDAGAWRARAFHYLARLAESRKQFATALQLYLAGEAVQAALPEDTNALGFVHLRIGELFASCGLVNSAQVHLDRALQLFAFGSNASSGQLQADLGQAALLAAVDQHADARKIAVETLAKSRSVGYRRGEFLSLSYLLLLDLRALDRRLIVADVRALVHTLRGGELRRNNVALLVRNLPVMLSMALHRLSLLRARANSSESLRPCPCSLHHRRC